MASFNQIVLLGNLTRDVDLRYTPNGKAVADISLALNHYWTDDAGDKQQEVTFVECTLFGRQAEVAAQFLRKGFSTLVSGRLKQENWTDRQTGSPRSKLKVICETLQLLEKAPMQVPLTPEQIAQADAHAKSQAPAPSQELLRQRAAQAEAHRSKQED